MKSKTKGLICGIIASVTYGMNPLFTLPLYAAGMSVDTVLFYRYSLAMLVLAVMMKVQDQSFALKKNEIMPLAIMGLLFSANSLFLFMSYNYMDAGIASTILFVYPVMVVVIMTAFFKERLSVVTILSILLALSGIFLLYHGDKGVTLSTIGTFFVLLSAFTYAVYIVGINRSSLKELPTTKVTFYALLFGLSLYIIRLRFCIDLQMINSTFLWADVLALSLLPTAFSMVFITVAIHKIGSTPTAILGALEPVTALFFGVFVFHEELTSRNILGIVLVIFAVMLVIVGKPLLQRLKVALQSNT